MKSRRTLAAIIDDKFTVIYISKIKGEHSAIQFASDVESLGDDIDDYIQQTLNVISLVLPLIPSGTAPQNSEKKY